MGQKNRHIKLVFTSLLVIHLNLLSAQTDTLQYVKNLADSTYKSRFGNVIFNSYMRFERIDKTISPYIRAETNKREMLYWAYYSVTLYGESTEMSLVFGPDLKIHRTMFDPNVNDTLKNCVSCKPMSKRAYKKILRKERGKHYALEIRENGIIAFYITSKKNIDKNCEWHCSVNLYTKERSGGYWWCDN